MKMMDTNDNGNLGGPAAPASTQSQSQRAMKSIYAVNERGGRSFWTRIGVGFENRDGSLTIKLDALPVNGTLQVREWESEKFARGGGGDFPPSDRPAYRRRDEAMV
jgi:hypothetical protein